MRRAVLAVATAALVAPAAATATTTTLRFGPYRARVPIAAVVGERDGDSAYLRVRGGSLIVRIVEGDTDALAVARRLTSGRRSLRARRDGTGRALVTQRGRPIDVLVPVDAPPRRPAVLIIGVDWEASDGALAAPLRRARRAARAFLGPIDPRRVRSDAAGGGLAERAGILLDQSPQVTITTRRQRGDGVSTSRAEHLREPRYDRVVIDGLSLLVEGETAYLTDERRACLLAAGALPGGAGPLQLVRDAGYAVSYGVPVAAADGTQTVAYARTTRDGARVHGTLRVAADGAPLVTIEREAGVTAREEFDLVSPVERRVAPSERCTSGQTDIDGVLAERG